MNASDIIERLKLEPLSFEGGFFRQTYKSSIQIPGNLISPSLSSPRSLATSIFYLITQESFSALHRLLYQEELFHFYAGDPVEMIQISEAGDLKQVTLGGNFAGEEVFQTLVPARVWQGTKLCEGGEWALFGATVTPGFEYEDFEMKEMGELLKLFPQHKGWIEDYIK